MESARAETAGFSDMAGTAEEAVDALRADFAKEAGYARAAGRAENADYAGEAGAALTAGWASRAGVAGSLDRSGCVDQVELSCDPLAEEELEEGPGPNAPDYLECGDCVDEDEPSF